MLVTIRDKSENENSIEIKRVYQHPDYQDGSLYNDIALLELGRRIIFDYEDVSFILNFKFRILNSI